MKTKKEKDMLGIKSITKNKPYKTFDDLINKMYAPEKIISQLQNLTIQIYKTEQKREKNWKQRDQYTLKGISCV